MNSEQPHGRWSQSPQPAAQFPHKPFVQEDTLKSGEVQIERKLFKLALKENVRGRLLRITEDIGARRNTIIVPGSGLREFLKVLDEMIEVVNQLPPAKEPGPADAQ